MPKSKATFKNDAGIALAGLLETPAEKPVAYALFAHCFTCSKDIAAASRIARSLASHGIATLRFDFTGLGNSDGDFANTNFSSNIEDLIAAAEYLEKEHDAPTLLIGHSLGGAAVLAAANRVPSARAIVTIGAPASGQHVEHLFEGSRDSIERDGEAQVDLGGRKFNVKKQFLEDIDQYGSTDHIARLKKSLLIFHAPLDAIVPIGEAARIYGAAKHPKSFVSLDQADHLLSKREDSEYVAQTIAAWASRYLGGTTKVANEVKKPSVKVEAGHVVVREQDHKFTQTVLTENHRLIADEPLSIGGKDLGPNPYEYLLAGLGACTSMTIRMYANRKKLPLDNVTIDLSHSRIHADDCSECESSQGHIDKIDKTIRLDGALDDKQRADLMRIADRCPVHKTLHNEILIKSVLAD